MPQREQDDIPYRSPITAQTNKNPVTKDEEQYDTLKNVFKILEDASADLYKEFNAFELHKDKPLDERGKAILHDLEVKQSVYEIIAPLVERVGNAIAQADTNFRRRQQK